MDTERHHHDVLATRDGVDAVVLAEHDDVHAALELLDRAESAIGAPLVDEAERHRLEQLHDGRASRDTHWHSLLARRDGDAVGYAGLTLPTSPGGFANGDVAMVRAGGDCSPILAALLASSEALSWRHQAGRTRLWVRHSEPSDTRCAADNGYTVERRLAVLGRTLVPAPDPVPAPDGVDVRAVTDDDLDQVVAILAAAYDGTPDGGWDRARLDAKQALDWYRHDDLLVADRDGELLGVHWTKRRGGATGEVYNLAVAPAAQGLGLGNVLLVAGLRHLVEVGCDEVLLWVDESNERAVRLYATAGFTSRWVDVAFGRALRGAQP